MDDFRKYEQLRDSNQSPRAAYPIAKGEGVDEITAIRMLRRVFGLSIVDAKKATGANEDFEKPQQIVVGGAVYWEGADTVEGSYLMQAKVRKSKTDLLTSPIKRSFSSSPAIWRKCPRMEHCSGFPSATSKKAWPSG
jgi:hypothetical protein